MWANPSGRSPKMSNSLRSLTKNERMSESLVFFEQIAHSLIFFKKMSDSLRKPMSQFPALVILKLIFTFYGFYCFLGFQANFG